MLKPIVNLLFEQTLFLIALIITILLSASVKLPSFASIDFKVLAFLSVLMLISAGLEKEKFLEKIATTMIERNHTEKKIAISMILTTMIIAMFFTNDVALITVVPITLIISQKGNFNPLKIIVLETIAANFGGSFTPMGNPQNIFLYNYYHLSFADFMINMIPFFSICLSLSLILAQKLDQNKIPFERQQVNLANKINIAIYLFILLLVLFAMFHIIPLLYVFVIAIVLFVFVDRNLFKQIDYFLLGTFILFFIIIDQISSISYIKDIANSFVNSETSTLVSASIFSQFISNVPSAILIAPFSQHAFALVIGVSIGGFGTTIASLANLISYKYYANQFKSRKEQHHYLSYFHKLNLLFLAVLLTLYVSFISIKS